eukprot:Sdes_comp16111_c0_seq1m5339
MSQKLYLEHLARATKQIYDHLPPRLGRAGTSILASAPKTPAVSSYSAVNLPKYQTHFAFLEHLGLTQNEHKAYWKDKAMRQRRSGRGPPVKGQGKRTKKT